MGKLNPVSQAELRGELMRCLDGSRETQQYLRLDSHLSLDLLALGPRNTLGWLAYATLTQAQHTYTRT